MRHIYRYWFLLLLTLVLAACAPLAMEAPGESTPAPDAAGQPKGFDGPAAVQKAVAALAAQLGLEPEAIGVHTYAPAEWPNACLGLPAGEEACAEVVTPGYGGLLTAGEQQFEFRVDDSGAIVRFIPGAALSARQVLAQQQQLTPEEIRFVEIEAVDWPDGCLGIALPQMSCLAAVTPGYRVVMEANGQRYEYRTNASGELVMLAAGPQIAVKDPAVIWESTGGLCETAKIALAGVFFGACDGAQMDGKFVSEARPAELQEFVKTFVRFEAETPAGRIVFGGQGERQPSEAEQRMLAEWAHLVYVEALGGRSGAAYGLAFSWHRSGGIAGFCDDLSVYVDGSLQAGSCKSSTPQALGQARLSAGQLEQLYAWIDALQPFEIDQTDDAKNDAMTLRLTFAGQGEQPASEEQQQAIQEFAAQLFAEQK